MNFKSLNEVMLKTNKVVFDSISIAVSSNITFRENIIQILKKIKTMSIFKYLLMMEGFLLLGQISKYPKKSSQNEET